MSQQENKPNRPGQGGGREGDRKPGEGGAQRQGSGRPSEPGSERRPGQDQENESGRGGRQGGGQQPGQPGGGRQQGGPGSTQQRSGEDKGPGDARRGENEPGGGRQTGGPAHEGEERRSPGASEPGGSGGSRSGRDEKPPFGSPRKDIDESKTSEDEEE